MKIDVSTKTPTGSIVREAAPRAAKSGAGAATAEAPRSGTQDSVQITATSSQLHAIESSLNTVPVVNTARVEAIKQAISEGYFKVNPEANADKLLATVKDLVSNRKA